MKKKKNQSKGTTKTKRNQSIDSSTLESVPGLPTAVKIGKRNASPYWQIVVRMNRVSKQKSSGTDDKKVAYEVAKQFYQDCIVKLRLGEDFGKSPTVSAIENDFLAQLQREVTGVKRNTQKYVDSVRYRFQNRIIAFFGTTHVDQIDANMVHDFIDELGDLGLAVSTINLHLVALRKFLTFAVRKRYINSIPSFSPLPAKDNPRPSLELSDYKALRRVLRQKAGQTFVMPEDCVASRDGVRNNRKIELSHDLAMVVPFWIYSFLRPTDVKAMKHKHIIARIMEVNSGSDYPGKKYHFLQLNLPESKRHGKPITTMFRAAVWYRKIRHKAIADKAKRLGVPASEVDISDDYVFLPQVSNRDTARRILGEQWNLALELAGISHPENGPRYTLYSLRHTSITYRIRFDDDDWHTIAANARTSVKCLERFYLSGYKTEQAARKVHGIPKSASVRAETISIDSLGFDVKSSEKPVVDRGSKKGTDGSPHAVYEKNWDYNDHSDGPSIGRTGASGIERLSWYQRQQPKMIHAAASSERIQ